MVSSVYSHAIYLRDCQGDFACLTTIEQEDGPRIARVNMESFDVGCSWLGPKKSHFLFAGRCCVLVRWSVVFRVVLPGIRGCHRFPYPMGWMPLLQWSRSCWLTRAKMVGLSTSSNSQTSSILACFLLHFASGQTCYWRRSDNNGCQMFKHLGYRYLVSATVLPPSGDDFLAALITVLHLPGGPFPETYREVGRYWANAATGSTTSVGAFLVQTAARGRAREPICRFIAALAEGDPDRIKQTARETLAFGSMSGTDWLVGLTAGLELGLWLQCQLEKGG